MGEAATGKTASGKAAGERSANPGGRAADPGGRAAHRRGRRRQLRERGGRKDEAAEGNDGRQNEDGSIRHHGLPLQIFDERNEAVLSPAVSSSLRAWLGSAYWARGRRYRLGDDSHKPGLSSRR